MKSMSNNKNGLATRTALYNSARECFYQKGYFDTSIQDIVTAAKSKLGLFSYHFESKEAAAVMVFREYVENVRNTLRKALAGAFEDCDLLLDDMLNYRGYFKGVLNNAHTAKFYTELSSTQGYLEQNFRLKEYYFRRLSSPQLMMNKCWRREDLSGVFISISAGMEIQLCRDICVGNIKAPMEDALDIYLDTYYSLLVKNKRQVAECIKLSRKIIEQIDWEAGPGFDLRITKYYDPDSAEFS